VGGEQCVVGKQWEGAGSGRSARPECCTPSHAARRRTGGQHRGSWEGSRGKDARDQAAGSTRGRPAHESSSTLQNRARMVWVTSALLTRQGCLKIAVITERRLHNKGAA
jgi:hypothetical protein